MSYFFMLFRFLFALIIYTAIAAAVWKVFMVSKEVSEIKRMLKELREQIELSSRLGPSERDIA